MNTGLVVARVIHILSAAVWLGGTVFLAAVAVPYARSLPEEQRTAVVTALGRRFRPVAWTALIGLFASGLYTMHSYGLLSFEALGSSDYGRGLMIKLGVAGVVFALAVVHDFVLGPRFERTGTGRGAIVALARTNGALTLVVVILGVILAH